MPRPNSHTEMTPQQKYEVFKNAYDKLNLYINNKEYLAAHVIAFSILEDRVLATRIQCEEATEGPLNSKIDKNKIPFEKSVNKLLEIQVISKDLKDDLLVNARERNTFLHQAMWRLEEFNHKSILSIRRNINKVEKCRRDYIKNIANR